MRTRTVPPGQQQAGACQSAYRVTFLSHTLFLTVCGHSRPKLFALMNRKRETKNGE
jgi:hypothetical protein